MIAVENSSIEMMKLLLDNGADPNLYAFNFAVFTHEPIEYAVSSGNIESIELLIKYGARNLDLAMSTAFYHKNIEIVKYLSEKGVKFKKEYLHTESLDLIKLVIESGIDPDAYWEGDELVAVFPKLFDAVLHGDTLMIRFLLEAGANPDLELSEHDINDFGSTEKKSPKIIARKYLDKYRDKNSADTILYLRIIEMLESAEFSK